jgi:hypothetical protein
MAENEVDINDFNLDSENTNKTNYPPTEQLVKQGPRSFLNEIRMDNTKRSTAEQCLRKFQLSHLLGLKSIFGSTALRYGSTWHKFMEGYYGTIKQVGWGCRDQAINTAILLGKKEWDGITEKQQYFNDYRTFENCVTSFLQYIVHFEGDQAKLVVIATEQTFALPVILETELELNLFDSLPPIIFTGKLDLQMELDGMQWINEFKSTGQALSIQGNRLYRSNQVIGYTYAGPRILNFNPAGTLVTLHLLTSRKTKDGTYGKITIDFARIPQVFNDDDLSKWKLSFLSTCKKVYHACKDNYFPCQFDSCFAYNRKCQFYGLCSQDANPMKYAEEIPEGFMQDFWDVENVEGDVE